MPDGDGSDIVEIEAMDKLPQSEGLTDAEVLVSQCVVVAGTGGQVAGVAKRDEVGAAQVEAATAPFTIIRPGPSAPPDPTAPPAPAAVEATPTFTG